VQLRRGLYLLSPNLRNPAPHPFALAQALHPGSYISFESALSFHGWIPEAVPVTLSVLPGRRRIEVDHGALGLFRFCPLALRQGHFLEAVDRHTFAGQTALVAQPLRAMMDIACQRKLEPGDSVAFVQSMRIDAAVLMQIPPATWQALQQVYAHKRTRASLQALHLAFAP
jgi:hypothetical protein